MQIIIIIKNIQLKGYCQQDTYLIERFSANWRDINCKSPLLKGVHDHITYFADNRLPTLRRKRRGGFRRG